MTESKVGFIIRVTDFAATKHKYQRRKNADRTPYINHPIAVARLLGQCGVTDYTVIAAALLHDTVEDTATTLDDIEINFGPSVSAIVAEVTDDKSLPKHVRKLKQIECAPHKCEGAKLVKLADKLDNLTSLLCDPPPSWSVEYVQGYFVWSRAVIEGLRGTNQMLEDRLDEVMRGKFRYAADDRVYYPVIPEDADHAAILSDWLDKMKPDDGPCPCGS